MNKSCGKKNNLVCLLVIGKPLNFNKLSYNNLNRGFMANYGYFLHCPHPGIPELIVDLK
ncbi:hypothetical protein ABIC84_001441 [Mucilaginibacter sp. 3215]